MCLLGRPTKETKASISTALSSIGPEQTCAYGYLTQPRFLVPILNPFSV